MSVVEPGGAGGAAAGIIARAQGLILRPSAEWTKIDGETPNPQALITGYALPLAGAAALAALIGSVAFGYSALGITYRPSLIGAGAQAVTTLAFWLIGVWVMSLIIDALAPSFDGQKNPGKALQVAVYSSTASWLAGLFQILPPLGFLSILGLYSVYLLYLGLPALMRAPKDKSLGYTAAVVIVAIVLGIVASAVVGGVSTSVQTLTGLRAASNGGSISGEVRLPGGATLNVDEIERASKELGELGAAIESGETPTAEVDLDALKALLPERLPGGFERVETSIGTAGVVGIAAAAARGRYEAGDRAIELAVGDVGPLAALASAFRVEMENESADGFERIRTRDGRTTIENLSKSAGTAQYAVLVRSRFLVSAEGSGGVAIDQLRDAVNAVGVERVERLAEQR